jgi:hypothetical protein
VRGSVVARHRHRIEPRGGPRREEGGEEGRAVTSDLPRTEARLRRRREEEAMIRSRLLCVALACAPLVAVAEPTERVESLAWLEGSWYGVDEGAGTEEHWTSPAGGGMVGMHKRLRGETMSGFEFLRIARLDEGGIGYIASPDGAAATVFRLKELGERRVVFENPEHDFPQRVLYWLEDDGTLHARVEGVSDGANASIEFAWRKR